MAARGKAVGASLLAASLLLGACSDDDSGEDDDSTEPVDVTDLIQATGSGTLAGAIEGQGDFTLQYPAPLHECEELAAAPTYVIPLPTRVGDAQIVWRAALPALDGAGTYALDDLNGLRATVTQGGEPIVYDEADATTAELTLDEDGGGEFSFSGLVAPDGATLGGGSSWACSRREETAG